MIRTITVGLLIVLCGAAAAEPYAISSSPTISSEASERRFQGLADLLTRTTGKTFVYRRPGSWPGYIESMRESAYQLLFDEPHLVGWRTDNLGHVPLVRLPGTLSYVVITREDETAVVQMRDLAGYAVCAAAPPALGGLVLLSQFHNPSRQPVLKQTGSGREAYGKVLARNCRGAVLRYALYEQLTRSENETRILFLSNAFTNWALSADPAVPSQLQDRIRQVLLDPENSAAKHYLNNGTSDAPNLLPTGTGEYQGYADLLKDFWGFQ